MDKKEIIKIMYEKIMYELISKYRTSVHIMDQTGRVVINTVYEWRDSEAEFLYNQLKESLLEK